MAVEYNLNKLNGRIVEFCGTKQEFAKRMGTSKATISKKLSNQIPFTQYEISKACEILQILPAEIGLYFFTEKVKSS